MYILAPTPGAGLDGMVHPKRLARRPGVVTSPPWELLFSPLAAICELDLSATCFAMVSEAAFYPIRRALRAEQSSHPEPGACQLEGNAGTKWASVSPLCNGDGHSAGGKIISAKGGSPTSAFTWFPLQAAGHPLHLKHTVGARKRSPQGGSSHFLPPGALFRVPAPTTGPARPCGIPEVGGGAGRRCPAGPAPSGRGGRGEAPRGRGHAPRGWA